MRIVTRPDFDGIVCAVLLQDLEIGAGPICWIEPGAIQNRQVEIKEGDILANLPYHENCSMWFDHHYTNRIPGEFNGAFAIAPSAAGVIYTYYRNRFGDKFSELVRQADKIDSADLSENEVIFPESNPFVLLSMTISGRSKSDEPYWNSVVELLREKTMDHVMGDPEVKKKCDQVVARNRVYKDQLMECTTVQGPVAVTDFRNCDKTPEGNRFLAYTLFKDAVVSVKIRYDQDDRNHIILSVGHSIFNKNCQVNAGLLLSKFNGGGHFGAAACRFHKDFSDSYIPEIVETLKRNTALESEIP